MKKTLESTDSPVVPDGVNFRALLTDIHVMIETSRKKIAASVNSALTILYWNIGARVHRDILNEERASYGKKILPTLSAKLVPESGNGFSVRNLARMIRFVENFKDMDVVLSLSETVSWSHFVELLSINDLLKRKKVLSKVYYLNHLKHLIFQDFLI